MALKRFVFATDVHGDQQDPAANAALFRFMKIWKPHIRVMGGDLWDFRPLRRKCSEDERRESMATDFRAGVKWMVEFHPTHFIRGNHDERLWELAALDRGIESDYAMQGVGEIESLIEKLGCTMLPYDKRRGILKIGHLKMMHGFHSGIYASRQAALIYGSVLFGHTHAVDEHAIPGLDRRVARNVGCLCSMDMEFAARMPNTLKQAHGFAYGLIDEQSGNYHVFQAEQIGKKWLLASEFIEL